MNSKLFKLLERKFQVEIDELKYDLEVLLSNERAIPEHSKFVDEVVKIIDAMTEAKDRLDTLRHFYSIEKE